MKRFYIPIIILFAVTLFAIKPLQAADALTDAQKDFSDALQFNDIEKLRGVVKKLGGINSEDSMKFILSRLGKIITDAQLIVYWEVVKGFSQFTNEEALDALADYILSNKTKPVSRDITSVLKNNNSNGMVKLLKKLLDKGNGALREQAVGNLGFIRNKNAIAALVEFLQTKECQNDQDLTNKAVESLHNLAGNNIGRTAETIKTWWEKHQNDDEKSLFATTETSENAANTGTAMDLKPQYVKTGFKKVTKERVLVIMSDCKGCEKIGRDGDHNYDHIQDILTKMNIPHTVVKKSEFDSENYKVDVKDAEGYRMGVWVIIMNCNHIRDHCVCPNCQASDKKAGLRSVECAGCTVHTPYTNLLSPKGVEKIKNFVASGGYFFSEDWVLEEVLERAWQGVVGHNKYYTDEKHVTILPGPGQTTHPYLKDVFEKPASASGPHESSGSEDNQTLSLKRKNSIGEAKWKIDKDSPDIKVIKSGEVVVLMVSEDLKTNDPKSGTVALTFEVNSSGQAVPPSTSTNHNDGYTVGKKRGGQVMHVLSHFGKQQDASDEFMLQNLILNFIYEAAERLSNRK